MPAIGMVQLSDAIEREKIVIGKVSFSEVLILYHGMMCFRKRRSEISSAEHTYDSLCRMWKSVGECPKDVRCFIALHITVERSFLWSIENFSTLKSHEKKTWQIKSHDN
ncbi:hypothetical protein AVEN_55740-1, partial [Araneus ventricosus]